MSRVHNFSAGPAALPQAVLERARDELIDFHGAGMSVMEMSHRGKPFTSFSLALRRRPRPGPCMTTRMSILSAPTALMWFWILPMAAMWRSMSL